MDGLYALRAGTTSWPSPSTCAASPGSPAIPPGPSAWRPGWVRSPRSVAAPGAKSSAPSAPLICGLIAVPVIHGSLLGHHSSPAPPANDGRSLIFSRLAASLWVICFCLISCSTRSRSRSRWLRASRSVSIAPSATYESGHFYFAQTGHSHFAATSHQTVLND